MSASQTVPGDTERQDTAQLQLILALISGHACRCDQLMYEHDLRVACFMMYFGTPMEM